MRQIRNVFKRLRAGGPSSELVSAAGAALEPFDAGGKAGHEDDLALFEQTSLYWHLGDWPRLLATDPQQLAGNAHRARIALLVASAHLQMQQGQQAAELLKKAQAWGASRAAIAQILTAGVHNSLGRAALLRNDSQKVRAHFVAAISSRVSEETIEQVAHARARAEQRSLGSVTAASLPPLAARRDPAAGTGQEAGAAALDLDRVFGSGDTRRLQASFLPRQRPAASGATHPAAPIFLHSLWRCSSTYFFNVFRRSGQAYWAYQEPFNESVLAARENPQELDKFTSIYARDLRHPALARPYFYEMSETHSAWRDKFSKESILDEYFAPVLGEATRSFVGALLSAARGRPVIQECRTSNRIRALREAFGGTHIYLWRNPWDTWWSMKVNSYFGAVTQILLGVDQAPALLVRIAEEIAYTPLHRENIFAEIDYFMKRPLAPEHSYLVFFAVWLLGLAHGVKYADLVVNVDVLRDRSARAAFTELLQERGIGGLDFSDCAVPQNRYSSEDRAFFTGIENKVYAYCRSAGFEDEEIDYLKALKEQYMPSDGLATPDDLLRNTSEIRKIVFRLERQLASGKNN